ncbi:hypothetical protein QE152_g4923 [Popillia japonica]|uniref:Uncharacterized protein n=1 Tax=Popillia japonica TaxID=7064 RepID=A0AAW1MZQ0_POPJA
MFCRRRHNLHAYQLGGNRSGYIDRKENKQHWIQTLALWNSSNNFSTSITIPVYQMERIEKMTKRPPECLSCNGLRVFPAGVKN